MCCYIPCCQSSGTIFGPINDIFTPPFDIRLLEHARTDQAKIWTAVAKAEKVEVGFIRLH